MLRPSAIAHFNGALGVKLAAQILKVIEKGDGLSGASHNVALFLKVCRGSAPNSSEFSSFDRKCFELESSYLNGQSGYRATTIRNSSFG